MKQSTWDAPESVLNYEVLSDYKWVSSFVSREVLEAELQTARREKVRVQALPLLKKDYLDRIRRSHDRIEGHRFEGLVEILREFRDHPDPLSYFQSRLRGPLHTWMDPIPSISQFEKGLQALPEGEISQVDRDKKVASIKKEVTKIQAKLIKLRGNEILGMAKAFVEKWRHIQRQVAGPVNIFGIDLDRCPVEEKEAWDCLGLSKILSDTAPFLPHPG